VVGLKACRNRDVGEGMNCEELLCLAKPGIWWTVALVRRRSFRLLTVESSTLVPQYASRTILSWIKRAVNSCFPGSVLKTSPICGCSLSNLWEQGSYWKITQNKGEGISVFKRTGCLLAFFCHDIWKSNARQLSLQQSGLHFTRVVINMRPLSSET
jgi:hypothetical protein